MAKPVLSDPIALRLPEDMLKDIETIAAATERTRSWVIVRALRLYLAAEGEEVLSLLKARDETVTDSGHDAEEVMRELLAIANGTKAA